MSRIQHPGRRAFLKATAASAALIAAPPLVRRASAAPLSLMVTNAGGRTQVHHEFIKLLGYFKEFDVDPKFEYVMDGSKILAAVISGTGDACMLAGIAPVFPAVDRGARLKIIAGANMLPSYVMMSNNPAVRTMKDLEGKVVGSGSPGALTAELTTLLLRKHGVDPKKVRMVNIGGTVEIFRAVVGKTVDAGIGAVNVYLERAKYGSHAVEGGLVYDEIPQYTAQGSFTSDRAIKEKREAIVRTLAAHAKSYRFLQSPDSKELYLRSFKNLFPTGNDAEVLGEWEYIQDKKPFAVDLVVSQERVDFLQELNLEKGTQKRRMNYDEIADMSLARDALALLK